MPATVHVAIGTDIIHMHPDADGAAIGEGSLRDFRLLAGVVGGLDGGVYLNLGSAVVHAGGVREGAQPGAQRRATVSGASRPSTWTSCGTTGRG